MNAGTPARNVAELIALAKLKPKALNYGSTPAGTPRDIVMRLNQDVQKVLLTADVKDKLAGMGAEILVSTPEQFQAHIKSELAKWGRAVKDSGARVE